MTGTEDENGNWAVYLIQIARLISRIEGGRSIRALLSFPRDCLLSGGTEDFVTRTNERIIYHSVMDSWQRLPNERYFRSMHQHPTDCCLLYLLDPRVYIARLAFRESLATRKPSRNTALSVLLYVQTLLHLHIQISPRSRSLVFRRSLGARKR